MMKQSERKDRADLVETFKRFSQRYCQCNVLDAFLICLLTASLFCPPFVCVGPAVAVLVRFFCTKKIFQGALRLPGAVALMAFGLLMLLVTCVRGEEFNIIVALGIVASLVVGLYFRQVMTLPMFQDVYKRQFPKIGELFGGRHYSTVMHDVEMCIRDRLYNGQLCAHPFLRQAG